VSKWPEHAVKWTRLVMLIIRSQTSILQTHFCVHIAYMIINRSCTTKFNTTHIHFTNLYASLYLSINNIKRPYFWNSPFNWKHSKDETACFQPPQNVLTFLSVCVLKYVCIMQDVMLLKQRAMHVHTCACVFLLVVLLCVTL